MCLDAYLKPFEAVARERAKIAAALRAAAAMEYNAPSQGERPWYAELIDLAKRYEKGEHDRAGEAP